MAEAKKMMESPEYQKQMKQFANSADFKDAAKKAGDMMKDPRKAAEMEAKMEHMMKVGADQLKANSGKTMEAAMAAMADPEVMKQMTQMIKDPSFQANLAQMASDPQFKQYIDSVSSKLALVSIGWLSTLSDNSIFPSTVARHDEGPRQESTIRKVGSTNPK